MVQPFTPSASEPTALPTDSKLAKTSCPLLVVEITLASRAAFRPLLGLAAVQLLLDLVTITPPVKELDSQVILLATRGSPAMVVKK